VTQTAEAYRDARSFVSLDHFVRDVCHGARTLRRSAGFSLVVLIVLAIGIGAITSVFTLLNRIVLRPLPFPEAHRLVVLRHSIPGLNLEEAGLSSGLYFHYRQHAQSLESLAVYSSGGILNLRGRESTERINVTYASAALFDVLRVKPLLGRLFTEEDGRPGFMNMRWTIPVLLGHDFWIARFAGDPSVVGRVLTINDSPRKVIGVMPRGFAFPDPDTQIWIMLEPSPDSANFARAFKWSVVARLRPEATPASAQTELARVLPRIAGVYEDATPEKLQEMKLAPRVIPLKSVVIGDVAHVLWTLLGGMALLLLIACANASALFAARAEHRRREIAVRQALGAHSRHVARLFFTEALMLTTAAAGLGLVAASALLSGVTASTRVQLPRASEIALDGSAMAFAATLAVLTAALYASLSLRRQGWPLTVGLLSGGHWATGGSGGHRWRDPFVVLQVALALALMAGSALMVKTYHNLLQTDLGFAPDGLLTVEVGLSSRKASQHARIYREVVERVGRLPGVERASATSFLPLTASQEEFPVEPEQATPVAFKFFIPGYFQTMRTPLLQGESFADGERVTDSHPVLVSAALARRLYPGQSAVGKTVRRLNEDGSIVELLAGPVPAFTIVGVVADVREATLRRDAAEVVYVPVIEPRVEQSITPTSMTLVIRSVLPPLTLTAAVREAVAAVDPGLSVGQVRTMESIVGTARGRETFVGALLLLAAAVSLFLGAVGIYGSVAQVVSRRTREIGIRMALGAQRAEVLRMVVTGSMRAVLLGAALGLIVALAATRMLSTLLFGVEPRDPVILLSVTTILGLSAVAAALVAARRAVHIAPLDAMRGDS
jgi:predicted permease